MNDAVQRQKDELENLRGNFQLRSELDVPGAAAPIEVVADMKRRCIDVGMTLRAPEDRKSTKARVNWLLKQIKTEKVENIYLRLLWPGKSEPTQFSISELRESIEVASKGKEHLAAHGFHVFSSKRIGARFTQ